MNQPQINPSLLTDVACDKCNNRTFNQVLFIKHLSALAAPDGNERVIPVPSFACTKCGHVNDQFIVKTRDDFNEPKPLIN